MDAGPIRIIELMTGASTRFVVPVFQRPYSWDEENCRQLWEDILATGRGEQYAHFTGSIVWIQDGTMSAAGVTRRLLIDGQQRITTITLLLIALARMAKAAPDRPLAFSYDEIMDLGYLVNKYKKGDDHYKLTLSQGDRDTLRSLIENLKNEDVAVIEDSRRLIDNLGYFEGQVAAIEDPNVIWAGLQRLEVVSISLTQGQDNPQLIFESMNSTGRDLSSVDLIRNYVLMGLPLDEQDQLYSTYWRPIEEALGAASYDRIFDDFVRDWLTVCYAPDLPSKRDVYQSFKNHMRDAGYGRTLPVETLLKEMQRFATYYAAITSGRGKDADIATRFSRIARLKISIVNPLLMSLYDDYRHQAFDRAAFLEMLDLTESYLFRRAACDLPTHGLNKWFPSVIARLDKVQDDGGDYLEAFTAFMLNESGTPRRFPTDAEFRGALKTRDSYGFNKSLHMLSRLENSCHPKDDERDFANGHYTIEHIMPQNALAHHEWVQMLGDVDEDAFEGLVHNIGNLTLTAYNSELSDGTFEQKKARTVGGYNGDIISISADLHDLTVWNGETISNRADTLIGRAVQVWPMPTMDEAVRRSYLPEKKGKQRKPVSFKDLFVAGLIRPGDVLVSASPTYAGIATVTDEGLIRLENGETFTNPSASHARLIQLQGGSTRTSSNGWVNWRLGSEDGPLIDELRDNVTPVKGASAGTESPNAAFRREFWQGFYDWCGDSQAFVDAIGDPSDRMDNTDSFADFGIGLSNCHISARVSSHYHRAEVGLYYSKPETFDALYEHREEIEADLAGNEVTCYWIDRGKSRRPAVWLRHGFDFDTQDVVDLYAWMSQAMLGLRAVAMDVCKG